MQYAKDEIKQRIIDVAKEEFQENGFEKASIRTITAKAKTSKSNLYNYFKDKDDLFCSVLQPTVMKIRKGLEAARSYALSNGINLYTQDAQKNNIYIVMKFVFENITDAKLLLFHAKGSSLEILKDNITDAFTDILYDWIEANVPDRKISRFFVQSVSKFYLNVIEQVIEKGTSMEELEKHHDEFVRFIYCGWQGVIQQDRALGVDFQSINSING